jgi:HD domain/Bacterial Ig domain
MFKTAAETADSRRVSSTIATSATGGSASSQADCLDGRAWNPRPVTSWSVRLLVLLIPVVVGIAAVKAAIVLMPSPDGRVAFWAWMAVLVIVSFGASLGTQRLMRRVAPVAVLLRMSLVFPDKAPSRFSAAMRTGSSRSIVRHLQTSTTESSPQQVAAEQLLSLVTLLGRHDRLTRGHAERVRAYSVMLGEQIGLLRDELDKLNWAALLHDIGKLEVPEALLNKPGRPTAAEWMQLRTHPGAGSKWVEPLRGWLGDWVDAATQHHERYDGTGYPKGLSGDNISLAGRIVAIADAYDVMTAARSYKKPLPAPQARAELARSSGTQFDPQLVRSFLEISLGRTRRIVGPLGWLAHFPDFIRAPLTVITTSTTGVVTAAAMGVATATGVISATEAPRSGSTDAAPYAQPFGDPAVGSTWPALETENPSDASSPGSATDAGPANPNEQAPAAGVVSTANSTPPTASTVATPAPISAGGLDPSPSTTTGPIAQETTPPVSVTPTTAIPAAAVPSTTAVAGPAHASDDQATTAANKSITIHILQNDDFGASDPDVATLAVLAGPSHGSVQIAGENLKYEPDPGYAGIDSFSYSICSQSGSCGQATVVVTITP